MTKKKILYAILSLLSYIGAAAETKDSIAEKRLEEVTVTGNSARQRIDNVRIGAERLELTQLKTLKFNG